MRAKAVYTSIKQLVRFGIVGAANTLISTVLMLLLYDFLGYWGASAAAYLVGALFSFAANRRFTFHSKSDPVRSFWRFLLVVAACYLCAYGCAKPLIGGFLEWIEWTPTSALGEKIAMLCGMVLYTALNFLGQKILVFRDRTPKSKDSSDAAECR